jgi:hypothetical protein
MIRDYKRNAEGVRNKENNPIYNPKYNDFLINKEQIRWNS